jgi:DAK2 domain
LTLRDGAQKVLDFIKNKDLSSLPQVLTSLVDDLEVTMGGTSGALYCIYLSALAQALRTSDSIPDAASQALGQLLNYTRARLGDRTMLDTLMPFCETLKGSGGDAKAALTEAKKGMEKTKELKASLGRSTYLDDSKTRGVPDPGAYGLLCLLEGFAG